MVQPLIAGYQERAQKETNEIQLLQGLAKKLGGEYTTLVQQVHENDIVKRVCSYDFLGTGYSRGRVEGVQAHRYGPGATIPGGVEDKHK